MGHNFLEHSNSISYLIEYICRDTLKVQMYLTEKYNDDGDATQRVIISYRFIPISSQKRILF